MKANAEEYTFCRKEGNRHNNRRGGEDFVKLENDPEGRRITELGGCGEMLEGAGRPLGLGPTPQSPEIHNFDIGLVSD